MVREWSQPDLARRFNIGRDSIGFEQLAKAIGDTEPVQITVHVDELADDESAIDFLNPNPPKDTAGRREDSGGGVRELQGR